MAPRAKRARPTPRARATVETLPVELLSRIAARLPSSCFARLLQTSRTVRAALDPAQSAEGVRTFLSILAREGRLETFFAVLGTGRLATASPGSALICQCIPRITRVHIPLIPRNKEFLGALCLLPALTHLSLHGRNGTLTPAHCPADGARFSSSLRVVSLERIRFSENSLARLTEAFGECTSLTEFTLVCTGESASRFQRSEDALISLVGKNHGLELFNIEAPALFRGTSSNPERSLLPGLARCRGLKVLCVGSTISCFGPFANFASTMSCWPALESLSLASLGLESVDSRLLAVGLNSTPSLEELDVSNNEFNYVDMNMLVGSLRQLPNIKRFWFGGNALSSHGMDSIVRQLRRFLPQLKV
jgi:hypothetical protein